ncbi:MAG: hypothetical protein H7201_04895 [Candidatus Saccharibacteria bacterium]|nr:hypothetical protein [Microbacteriaceae bacterium]
MLCHKLKITKILAGTALAGMTLTSLGVVGAAPAQAATATSASQNSYSASAEVTLDVEAIISAIYSAVNDHSDRGGAVQAGLDVGYWNAGNPDRLTVAIVNKNQNIIVEGDVADARYIDIKGGNYVIYWFKGPGRVTNYGDGGWINWGVFGNIYRDGNVIHVNGG